MQQRPLRVLLGTTGQPPYEETAQASIHGTVSSAVLGELLRTTANFSLAPGLISSWHWDESRHGYALTMREDIVFHNGRRADAADLEFVIVRGLFSRHRAFYAVFLEGLEGMEHVRAGDTFRSGAVTGVQITGPYTVFVRLQYANPGFLYALCHAYFAFVAREALQADYIQWQSFPIGAGPYRITGDGFAHGRVMLEKVRGGVPTAADHVELYTADVPGIDYDISLVPPPAARALAYTPQYTDHPSLVMALFFSAGHPLSRELRFRQAVTCAINRAALAEGIEAQYAPAHELLPQHGWGRANVPDVYDPPRARALIAALPPELLQRTWRVPVFSGSPLPADRQRIADRLRAQCAAVGLTIEFYPSLEKFISDDMAASTPMFFFGMVVDYVDPGIMFSALSQRGAFPNERPVASDPVFEDLYSAARRSATGAARVAAVRALSAHTNAQVLLAPLLEAKNVFFINPETIKSLGEQDRPLYLQVERVERR